MTVRTRTTRRIYPAEPDEDMDIIRWLIREGFERSMNGDSLRVIDYDEELIEPKKVAAELAADGNDPATVRDLLGAELDDFHWWVFTCHAATDDDLMDYLTAESAWKSEQYRKWLDAEARHRAAAD